MNKKSSRAPKKPWVRPELLRYGKIAEVTQKSGANTDTGTDFPQKKNKGGEST